MPCQQRERERHSLPGYAVVPNVFGDVLVDTGGQRQVEEAVRLGAAGQSIQVRAEFQKGLGVTILPAQVGVPAEKS